MAALTLRGQIVRLYYCVFDVEAVYHNHSCLRSKFHHVHLWMNENTKMMVFIWPAFEFGKLMKRYYVDHARTGSTLRCCVFESGTVSRVQCGLFEVESHVCLYLVKI